MQVELTDDVRTSIHFLVEAAEEPKYFEWINTDIFNMHTARVRTWLDSLEADDDLTPQEQYEREASRYEDAFTTGEMS